LVAGLVSLSLLIITVDYREGPDGPLARAGAAAHAAMAPLQRAVTSVTRPIGNFFSGLVRLPSLEDENRRLQQQVDDLLVAQASVEQLQSDLATLSNLLNLQRRLDPTSIPAVVIANGLSDFEQVITIDRGRAEGVAIDMPVVTGSPDSARLVGHVISVTAHSADVELIIDRGSVTAGVVDQVEEVGTVTGQGQADLEMDDITKTIDLTGSPPQVFTVAYSVGGGQHGLYPPGLLIGEVSRVYKDDNQLQTSVSVRPAVDFSSLSYVLVLATPQRGNDAT